MDQSISTEINSDSLRRDWKIQPTAQNRVIMNVLRKSLRERKCPRSTVYGILVTDNYKTYKTFSSPYGIAGDGSDYVLKFGKAKPHAATTQTSKCNFVRKQNGKKTIKRNIKTFNPITKQDKATQVKNSDKMFQSNEKEMLNRSYNFRKIKKCMYYYTQALNRSKKKLLKKYLKCKS